MVNCRTLISGSAAGVPLVVGTNTNAVCYLLETIKPTVLPYHSGMAASSFELWLVDLDLARGQA
jgi:hypothetical protein